MIKKTILSAILAIWALTSHAQQKGDTIILELAKTSKVIFTIQDRSDLETLKQYDFQKLFQDVLTKLEANDTSALPKSDTALALVAVPREEDSEDWSWHGSGSEGEHNNNDDWNVHYHSSHWGRTWQSFNLELGTNNYLSKGKFPDNDNALYAVRPWGSWYVGLSSIQRTRMSKKFFLEWGVGVNWYNFKFQDDNVLIQKDDDGIHFVEDTRDVDYIKSKLTASFVTASLVPLVDFGGNSRKSRFWEGGNSFRIGLGPYVGYRIASHSKLVYKDDDGKEKEKNHDNLYLNNFRYGARLQIGYRSTDLFFNYDLNELFVSGKGPNLNAFSFGVIF